MAKLCSSCNNPISIFANRVKVSDGHVCMKCWNKAGFDNSVNTIRTGVQYSGYIIKEMIEVKENNRTLIANFKATKKIGTLAFDDNNRTFIISKGFKNKDLYRYDQIISFELLEDGESITKGGLSGAVVGGLLFGGVGAIVGGVTGRRKTKKICNSLQVKITFRHSPRQTEYLNFLSAEVKTNSIVYKTASKSAQDTLSALQLAVDMANAETGQTHNVKSSVDVEELKKYKELLDVGIISQDEFNAKKAQILGL